MARYPDLRYKFIRGLIKYEHRQRRHQFLKPAAEWTSKAIVSLSLIDHPIRSIKQAMQLEGVGPVIASELKRIVQDSTQSGEPPPSGKLPSTGSALLVALLIGTEEERKRGSSDIPLVGEEKLKEYCEQLSEEKFNPKSYAVDGSLVLCPAWWRINVLIGRGLVKKRTRGKRPVYELLPYGEKLALNIRGDDHRVPTPLLPSAAAAVNGRQVGNMQPRVMEQSTPVHPPSHGKATNSQSDALYSNDDGLDGVLLLVDRHELGGDRVRLGELSRRLSEWDVRHRTSPLPCGDYMWKWRHNGKETTLPVLMERKRADDLAGSIKDGRYFNQKEKMLKWKKEFGVMSRDVSLQYVVESEPAAYRVACTDGCNGVGKCGNPTVEQVEEAISELEESVDFQLLKTRDIEGTMELLASITAELTQRVNKGEFEALASLPVTHTKSGIKASKAKHSVGTDYGLNYCTSPVYSHSRSLSTSIGTGTLHHGMSLSVGRPPRGKHSYGGIKEGTPESPSRKRPRYQAIKLDDLTETTTTQVSLPKKKRNSSKTSTTTSLYDSDMDDDLVLKTPVFNPNTSRSVLDKAEERYESDRHRLSIDAQCSSNAQVTSSHISNEWSDSDDDLPPGIAVWDDTPFKYSSLESIPETETSQFNLGHQTGPMSQIPKSIAQSTSVEQSDEDKITMLRDMLPDSSLEDIITALSSAGGSVQKVIMERVNSTETKASELVGKCTSSRYSPLSKYAAVRKDYTTTSNSSHRVEDSDDAKIAAVKSALPDSSLGEVIAALTSAGGNVEQAIIETANRSELDISRKPGDHSTTKFSRVAEEIKIISVPTASSPSYNVKSSDEAGKIATVQEVLPDSSLENIVSALSSSKGDVEQAIMEVVNNSKMEHSLFIGGNPAGRSSPNSNESLLSKRKSESCSLEHFDEAKIALVQDVLPDASLENVITALNMTGGNVEQAILESIKISENEAQALDECTSFPCSLPLSKKTLVSNAPLSTVARCSSDIVKYSDGSNTTSVRHVLPGKSLHNAVTVLNKSRGNVEQIILESEETEGLDDKYSSPTPWNKTVLSKGPVSTVTSDSSSGRVNYSEDVKIAAVRVVLPDTSMKDIVHALNTAEGNVEQAILELLDTPKHSVKQHSSTSSANCGQSSSNEVIDLT